MVLFAGARAGGDLAAGCMGAGQGGPNLGETLKILGAIKLNPDKLMQQHAVKFRSCGFRYDAARTGRRDLEGRVAIAIVPDNLAPGA